jgi:hypothetical protein
MAKIPDCAPKQATDFMPLPCSKRDRLCPYVGIIDLPGGGGTFMCCTATPMRERPRFQEKPTFSHEKGEEK